MLMMRVQLPLVMMILIVMMILMMMMVVIDVMIDVIIEVMIEVINMMILRVGLPLVRLQEAWPPIDASIVGVDWAEIIIIMILTEAK